MALPSPTRSIMRVSSTIARPTAQAPVARRVTPQFVGLDPPWSSIEPVSDSNPTAVTDIVASPVGRSRNVAEPSAPVVAWRCAFPAATLTTAPPIGRPLTSVVRISSPAALESELPPPPPPPLQPLRPTPTAATSSARHVQFDQLRVPRVSVPKRPSLMIFIEVLPIRASPGEYSPWLQIRLSPKGVHWQDLKISETF